MTQWDIVSDVCSGPEVAQNKAAARCAPRMPSSSVVAVALAVSAAVAEVMVPPRLLSCASEYSIVLTSERAGPVRGPTRQAAEVDFTIGRSPEKLASGFEAFFQPAADEDEGDQVPYAFS
jgi:hypothetical protein